MKKILVLLLCFDMLIAILFSFGIHHAIFIMFGYVPLLVLNILVVNIATKNRWRYAINGLLLVGIFFCLPEYFQVTSVHLETAKATQFRVIKYADRIGESGGLDYRIYDGSMATLGFTRTSNIGSMTVDDQQKSQEVQTHEEVNKVNIKD